MREIPVGGRIPTMSSHTHPSIPAGQLMGADGCSAGGILGRWSVTGRKEEIAFALCSARSY